jgi:peroxin-2
MQSGLQLAWDNAQPKLIEIRKAFQSHPSPKPRVIRVGQLDSELLDQELVHLLKEPLSKALGFVNARKSTTASWPHC